MQLKSDPLKNPCLDYVEHIVLAPPGATFEEESAPKKPAGGAVASTVNQVGETLKGQAVTSGGPDMERILRQGFIRKV